MSLLYPQTHGCRCSEGAAWDKEPCAVAGLHLPGGWLDQELLGWTVGNGCKEESGNLWNLPGV